jgi:hypothetical protein
MWLATVTSVSYRRASVGMRLTMRPTCTGHRHDHAECDRAASPGPRERSGCAREGDPHDRHVLTPRPANTAGVGPIVAVTVLAAWSHGALPRRRRVSNARRHRPHPSLIGPKAVRHRLNRSGDRQLNPPSTPIVLTRRRHPRRRPTPPRCPRSTATPAGEPAARSTDVVIGLAPRPNEVR